MAKALLFVDPDPDGMAPFRIVTPPKGRGEFKFARLPCVGEFVHLGQDEDGISADYEVVLVWHLPAGMKDVDAEIYMKRIDVTEEIGKKEGPLREGPWKEKARPAVESRPEKKGTITKR